MTGTGLWIMDPGTCHARLRTTGAGTATVEVMSSIG
jgi:hypothetical protein